MNILERVGSAICHQMAERSFIFDGMQMPLCARCTGIYTGVFLAFCFFFLKKRMGNSKTFSMPQTILTAAAVLPVGIDGVGSYLGFWESSQFLRILTGSIVGAVLPGFLLLAGNFEPDGKNDAALYEKTTELLLLMLVSVGFGFCLLAGMPLYWFGAVFSVAGEVLFWGGIIWLLMKNILKKEIPYWRISVLVSFVVLFLIGGVIS